MLNKKSISILQISLMVVAIFAFAFILEGAFVSSTESNEQDNPSDTKSQTGNLCRNFGGECKSFCGDAGRKDSNYDCPLGTYCCNTQQSEDPFNQEGLSQSDAEREAGINLEKIGTKGLEVLAAGEGTKLAGKGLDKGKEAIKNLFEGDKLLSQAGDKIINSQTDKTFFGKIFASPVTSVVNVLAVSAAAFAIGRYVIGPLTGMDLSGSQALGYALAAGFFVTETLATGTLGMGANAIPLFTALSSFGLALGIGAVVALIIFALVYKKTPVEVVQYNCLAWQPQKGGEFCDECNHGELPCTEYQCRSLGSSCEIVNRGTGEEICFFANRTDVKAPIIEVNKPKYDSNIRFEAYGDTRFPEDRGVKLVNTNTRSGCYSPYDPILIAIALDEPGICKYSFFRDRSYDEMPNVYFSNGLSKYNHSTSFNMPGRAEIEAENLTFFEGLNKVYIRCEDYGNANQNIANYVFDFCVDESPDLTEPVILGTNPLTNSYISFDTSSIDSTFYIDKPAECKWDHFDMSFDQMQNSMSCATSIGDGINLNQRLVYPCKTTLTGLQNYVPNDFYISCKSYPNKDEVERMEMGQSYKYTLIGTRPLAIDSVAPDNETMRGSAEIVTVNLEATTIEGAENDGTATCFYDLSNSGKNVEFFETDSYRHTQELFLGAGNYNIKITCVDAGGNIAIDYANFRIEVDKQAPIITRAYYENNRIVLMTNEEATCVYNTNTCDQSYDDSIKISSSDDLTHNLAWDTEQNLYIKCEDQYGNRPMPKECSIIVRGHELFSLTN